MTRVLPSACTLLATLCFPVALFALVGCGSSGANPDAAPDSDAASSEQVFEVGDETLIILEQGSLISERPTDSATRRAGLSGYLTEQRARFGQGELDPGDLTFADAIGEEEMGDAADHTHTLLALHQTHLGAPIIDVMLMGAYAQSEGGDELRRVRGRLLEPDTLPTPPTLAERPVAVSMANSLAIELGLSADRTLVSDGPVISANQDTAGFLVTVFEPAQDGGAHQFEAIVDPVGDRYVILTDQPACGLPELAAGAELGAGPVFEFDPPTDNSRSIRIHAVQLSDADNGNVAPITRDQVRRWALAANTVWHPEADIRFLFDDSPSSADFETWRATRLNTLPTNGTEEATYRAVGNVWALLFQHQKLVIFFRSGGGHGFSWGPPSTFFVSMPSYTETGIFKPTDGGWLPNDTLLSHEIGHYMGLAHTFGGESCESTRVENGDGDAGGQDPNTAADDVSDTAPDMRDACVPTDSLTCAGGNVNYNSQQWTPPWSNVMSYHDCMPEQFSDDQVGAINLTLQHPVRAGLVR